MNTRRIWILAVIFGMVMSILFYIVTTNGNTNSNTTTQTSPSDESQQLDIIEPPSTTLEIATDKRAISIAVDVIQSVSGFVEPGSYVDVIAIIPAEGNEQRISQILLENIKVLAVGTTLKKEEDENQEPYQMVTLEVSPTGGASLALAKEIGTVTLMLRGSSGERVISSRGSTTSSGS